MVLDAVIAVGREYYERSNDFHICVHICVKTLVKIKYFAWSISCLHNIILFHWILHYPEDSKSDAAAASCKTCMAISPSLCRPTLASPGAGRPPLPISITVSLDRGAAVCPSLCRISCADIKLLAIETRNSNSPLWHGFNCPPYLCSVILLGFPP